MIDRFGHAGVLTGSRVRIDRESPKLFQRVLDTEELAAIRAYEAKMRTLEPGRLFLRRWLVTRVRPLRVLHPSLAEVLRARIAALSEALGRPDARAEAAESVRALVSTITLTPEAGALAISLRGDLAAMLGFAAGSRKPGALGGAAGASGAMLSQSSLVAGTGFEPVTFRL